MKVFLLGLALLAGLGGARTAAAQVPGEVLPPPPGSAFQLPVVPAAAASVVLQGEVALSARQLAQLVATRNADIRYSRMAVDVGGYLSQAEAALYESVFFANARTEDRLRQRTVEERLATATGLSVLDERLGVAEAGLRQRVPTGGEVSVAYRVVRKRNNIIAAASPGQDTEYTGALVLSVKQPLLRNSGRQVLETDLRIAQLEHGVQWMLFRQQVLKATADALSLYWQLHRAQEGRRLRQESIENVRRLAQDVDARIEAGRVPLTNRVEVLATVLAREAELTRSEQGVREAQARVMTALSLSPQTHSGLALSANPDLRSISDRPPAPDAAFSQALDNWPPYQVARLRLEQGRVRLQYAENQRLPLLDLNASYSGTGLANTHGQARSLATSDRFPDWNIGVSLEMPLEGNGRAASQAAAQRTRVQQSELELEAIRVSLANDLAQRLAEVEATRQLIATMRGDLEQRQALLAAEQERFRLGVGQLFNLLQRENEVLESRQRLAEATMRNQLATVALGLATGGLLDEHDISLRSEP